MIYDIMLVSSVILVFTSKPDTTTHHQLVVYTTNSNLGTEFNFFFSCYYNLCCSSEDLYILFALLQQTPQVSPCFQCILSFVSDTPSASGIPTTDDQYLTFIISYRIKSKLKTLNNMNWIGFLTLLLTLISPFLPPLND